SPGCTVPGASGQGAPGPGGTTAKRLDTHTPLIGSAGCDAYQLTQWVPRPLWVRMFHNALVVRLVLDAARMPSPSGRGSVKPWMPCLCGRFPVATDVHSIGDSIGWSDARLPHTPRSRKPFTFGMSPRSTSGRMTFQSAASQ